MFMGKTLLIFYYLYSLFICLYHLPFKVAIKIPILIHPRVKTRIDRSSKIYFPNGVRRSMLIYGFKGTEGCSNHKSLLCLKNGGQLVINGLTIISKGSSIVIDRGRMEVGDNFFCNGDCIFHCKSNIKIGKDNMYGWNVRMNTSDGHLFFVDGVQRPTDLPITIGNHVWIGSYCNIGKGAVIPDECVIAQYSLVHGHFQEINCLIGGVPACVLKRNIDWSAK